MMATTHIGERVRAARKRRALRQVDLAEAAGLSVDTISKMENGLHEPHATTVQKLSKALGVPVEHLTTDAG